jgi:hypothetical protein
MQSDTIVAKSSVFNSNFRILPDRTQQGITIFQYNHLTTLVVVILILCRHFLFSQSLRAYLDTI